MKTKIFTDQAGRKISIPVFPQKIISLVPSQTELLYALGLDKQIAGITKFCVLPAHWRKTKAIVGGTKQINLAVIRALEPDLIIANKEENTESDVAALQQEFPVWVSDVADLNSALLMIRSIGEITGCDQRTENLIAEIKREFEDLEVLISTVNSFKTLKVCYLIWQKPYMAAGGNTFIDSLLHLSGFVNVFRTRLRYPVITLNEIRGEKPDILFLSSEPYPFQPGHAREFEKEMPGCRVLLVDGQAFSWYGSRLQHFPSYVMALRSKLNQSILNT